MRLPTHSPHWQPTLSSKEEGKAESSVPFSDKMEPGNIVEEYQQEVQGEKVQEIQESVHFQRNLVKKDAFDLEAGRGHNTNDHDTRFAKDWGTILKLGFQCVGIVYGNLGTSPLYVIPSIFPHGIKHDDDLLGALSLIIYTVLIITLIKYVFVVLAANDNGDGGTFALYSLICRYAKVNLIPNQQAEDREVSNYKLDVPDRRVKMASALKSRLENSNKLKYILLIMTMLSAAMVIGDGILTPSMSVLSAVGGIKEATTSLNDAKIMWISVVIVIILFQIQRFGTDKVGYTFAPILLLWFSFIAFIGIYNYVKYDPGAIKAFNPRYIVQYFQRNGRDAWISLGGVMLCVTGSEALFADLGHFNIRSMRLSACIILVPSILLAYFGQVSYLRVHHDAVNDSFYKSVPKTLLWPQFVLAVCAAIIASQSLISASFSIVQQSEALACFPRVKVVHTSAKYEGQVYIPEINTFLMLASVGVTLGLKNTLKISNAYGIAVALVFVMTSLFMLIVMVLIWKTHAAFILLYVLTIGLIELVFLTSSLYKFVDGGYLPLLSAILMVIVMFTWNYGHRKKHMYELENQVSPEKLSEILSNPKLHRFQGIGLFYTPLVDSIPPIFTHAVTVLPAVHTVVVFVTMKSLPISRILPEDRFLFKRVNPEQLIFRCIVRYGYIDSRNEESFEEMLVKKLKEFIEDDGVGEVVERELALVDNALNDGGLVYLMWEGQVVASKGSKLAKRLTVDYLYNWLSRCVRRQDEHLHIPRDRLLKLGMTYEA